jgi:predicted DCC family thiol-disulfide oxidoreductase YuxK
VLANANLPDDIADKSIVVYDGSHALIRSKAVVRVLHHMGAKWSAMGSLLDTIPAPLADAAYSLIARYRKHLPHAENCQLLSPDKRARFLP